MVSLLTPIDRFDGPRTMPHFSLIAADRFAAFVDTDAAVVIDSRPAADYWRGHLPGARHLDAALVALPRTDAASLARFQALLGFTLSSLGVGHASQVLVYGAANEVNVSRLAWALAYAGVEHVALLDGGLKALADAALTTEAPLVRATPFVPKPVTGLLATEEQVARAGTDVTLIDARERDEFLGLKSNARRHGRIPGARHWDASGELDAQGRLQAPAALAELGRESLASIVYCGGGGRAARTLVAMHLAGRRDVAVYPGSWNEWGNGERAIESGDPEIA
jgi:thiosulfate/3-mercaptopyruvate sulfurtransferase